MPLYEYECDACGHRFEKIRMYSDPPLNECPKCGSAVHKLQSAPAIQFKGTGFYITDYAKKDSGAGGGKAGEGQSEKSEKNEKNEKSEKSEKTVKGENSDKGSKADKGGAKESAKSEGSSASTGSTATPAAAPSTSTKDS
jgi:putative FmdB family regulatory protein